MSWRELTPVPMTRVALVARDADLRAALVRVGDAGAVEFDRVVAPADVPVSAAARALQRLGPNDPVTRLAGDAPDLDDLERAGRADLLAGEVSLVETAAQAVSRDGVAALLGWTPAPALPELTDRLAPVGGALVPLPAPRGVQPPTATRRGATASAFAPLVDIYATVPYRDLDPTIPSGLAYAAMFGAMFGDVGHGALLVAGALLIRLRLPRSPRWQRLSGLRPHALLVAAAGVSAMVFGLVYGECFGPTGLVGPGLVAPLDQPMVLLVGGVAFGAVLLAGAYAIGTVNRLREGGFALALYSPAGIAGTLLFAAAGTAVAAWYWHLGWLGLIAGVVALVALALAFVGLRSAAGGGGAGVAQSIVETFDLVIRLGTNVVSFARLAAFGLTHAVLGLIVWEATVALWRRGGGAVAGAVLVFVVGNLLAFGLEALVAAIQALRLEYYELFSRVFRVEGRQFQPWHVPTDVAGQENEEASCRSGFAPSPLSV
jgi:V/A-type H+/Na+-transporting ATPase subunit I